VGPVPRDRFHDAELQEPPHLGVPDARVLQPESQGCGRIGLQRQLPPIDGNAACPVFRIQLEPPLDGSDREAATRIWDPEEGGINPNAVEWMHRIQGSRGKVVWLPTFESDKHVKTFGGKDAKGLVVAPGGVVTPEMEELLKIIARENLVLATGHVHPEEILAVVKRGNELGAKNIVITHGLTNVPGLTMEQAKQVVSMGAVIEVCFLQFQAGPNAPLAFLTHWTQINAKHIAQGVKEFGAKGIVVSSDLGQSANITHPDGLEVAIGAMKREGISDADIDLMVRKNPAKLLGLAN
jgi:hypothetical protein